MTRKCGDFSPGLEVIAPTRHCRASTRQSISFVRLFRRIMDARIKSGHDIEWAGGASPTRLQAAIVRRRGGNAELGFQRRDARLQRLVLLARQPRHVLDRLELLALDDVEVAQDLFGLIADHGVDLTLDALGGAGGVVHQAPDLVEKPVAGLGHLENAPLFVANGTGKTMAIPAPPFKPVMRRLALSCRGFLAIVLNGQTKIRTTNNK